MAAASSSSTAPPAKKGPSKQDVAWTYACGIGIMLSTAPVIHPLNVTAAAAAKTQLKTTDAALAVRHGLGGNPTNAMSNFWSGMTGHLSKEIVRSWGRIAGVVYFEPWFKENFSPSLAPHLLACVMATYEILFANPADVWKSYRSTGMATRREDLFKGSLGNFVRQYLMWFVWSKSIPYINNGLTWAEVDPSSKFGIAARSVTQSACCTVFTYPAELVLRTVQVRAAHYSVRSLGETIQFAGQCIAKPSMVHDGAYVSVVRDLVRHNGVRGLFLGWTAKFMGNAVLLGGANFLPMITSSVRAKAGSS